MSLTKPSFRSRGLCAKNHMKTKHVVNFSGGVCSFLAAHRVVSKYGKEGVTLLFADTQRESKELYRFCRDAEEFLGIPLTKVSAGKSVWEVCFEEHMIANSRVPICSMRLKREILDEWTCKNCDPSETILYFGMDYNEIGRLGALRKRYPNWQCEAPMQEPPFLDKDQMLDEVRELGLDPSKQYALGFSHDNCGGRCFASGQANWALALQHDREGYLEDEKMEQQFRAKFGDYSILKDRRNKQSRPMSLKEFRERIEKGDLHDKYDFGGCGCSVNFA